MRYKKIMILTIILTCLLAVSAVSAAENATEDIISTDASEDVVSVEETTDDVVSVENDDQVIESSNDGIDFLSANPAGTFTDLANEIVNATGELKLSKNYVYDATKDSNYKNGIIINKEITINGRGFIINGNNNACAFNVSESNVILKNIEFTDCYSSDNGGAIYWNGVNGSLYDCNFIKCNISNNGGVIYWNGDNGSLFDCSFVDCSCSVFSSRSTSSGVFSGSSSTSISGGVIYWNGANGKVFDCDFTNCKNFISNSHTIYLSSYTPGVMPTSSSKSNSLSYGGAIYWNGPEGSLYNCDFINCYSYSYSHSYAYSYFQDPQHTYATYSASSACTCYSYSYGVYWKGNNGNLSGCNFLNSSSSYSSDSSSDSESDSLSHNTVKASTSTTSSSYGGAIYWNGDDGHLFNCNFITSTAYSSSNSGSNSKFGGAIYWYGNNGNIFNSSFRNCHVPNKGYADSIYWYGDNGNLLNSNFVNSGSSSSTSSSSYNGAVYWKGDQGKLYNCGFNGNYYNYESFCKAEKSVCPVILIHASSLNNDERVVIFQCTQLVNPISVKLYDVTDKKVLYDEFDISSSNLVSSLNLNNLPEGEYQIVLEYNGDNFYTSTSTNDLFKIGKNSSFEVTITDNHIEGDDATINVTLNEDATGRIKLILSNYTIINELVGGKSSFYIPYVLGGNNTYKLKYEGDEKYNPIYTTGILKALYKSNIKLNLTENNVFDENILLNYTITPKCTGNISILVDNVFKGIITVNDTFNLENISVGNHNVTVIYNGDEYYLPCNDTSTISVSKADSSIIVNSSNFAGNVIFEVILNEKATGNVTITINNNPYPQSLTRGKTNITISNLAADDYTCVIYYEGDSNYNPITYNYDFTLQLKKSTIDVTVDDINYGDKLDVQFNLTNGATGTISIYLNNSFINTTAIGEKINLPDLTVGKYMLKLVYNGDDYYESCENTTTFNVLKMKPTIDSMSASSTSQNITFGDIVDINYHITDGATGTINVYVDSVLNKTVNVGDSISITNLNSNYHTIKLVYNGDNNYQSCENNITFEVLKKNIDISTAIKIIDMVYGKTQITFTSSFEGVLNINASNKYHKSFNINANINYLNLSDIDADDYDVEYVFVPKNQNYNNAITLGSLTVFKAEPTFNIVIDDVNYKDDADLNIIYLNDVVGFANITISNNKGFEIKYSNVALTGTKFTKVLNDLNASKYTITFEYTGNNNYYSTTEYKTFNVFKIDPIMMVDVTNATYGQNAKITANCNVDGNITITIGSVKTYNELLITDKRVSQNVNDIDAGTYDVKVIYNGNNNYNTKTVNTKLSINKVLTTVIATADDRTYSQTSVINVKASIDGEVTVKIDNSYFNTTNVEANTVTPVTFDNIPAGPHNVLVTLTPSNKNYNESSFKTGFAVSKKQTSITLGVENSIYGEEVIVNVTADADGKITLKVGDITRERNVLADTMVKINFGVLAANSYNVEATFDAGENYKPSNKQTTLTVSPAKAEINSIQVQNNTYGENTFINVKTNVAGVLTVKLNNANAQIFNIDANKLTTFDLGKYDANNYDIDLTLDAGSNYAKATGNAKITVNPKQTTVELKVNDNVYGKNVIVNVTASENGKVTVNVGTNVRIVDVEANKLTSVDFGILDAKSYDINATFDGGKNYQTSFDKDSLLVSPKASSVTMVDFVNSYVYAQNVIIKMKTDADGTLTVKVGDTPQTKQVMSGNIVTFDFGILDVNNYGVTISLDAGNNYIPYQNTTSIVITPKSTSIVINAKNYDATEKVIVNVTASENGKVTIKLGSITKTTDVNANTLTSVDFGLLDVGSYNVVANFTAGNNYINSTATCNVKVLSKINDDDVNITIPEIVANQENQIVVNLPSDATGTVSLIIGNNTYPFTVNNGVATVKVPKLEDGTYEYVIEYSGDNNYSSFSTSGNIDVSKPTPDVEIPPLDKPSSDGSVTINLPQGATGTVTLVIDKKPYSFPVQNGVAKIYMPELINGNYPYTITYSGDGKYSAFTKEGSLTVNKQTTPAKPVTKTTLTLKKVTVKRSAKKLTIQATLKVNGKSVKGKIIKFKFNKKSYKAKTNAKGVAKITVKKSVLKKLKKGKKVTYTASYGKITKKVTVKVK